MEAVTQLSDHVGVQPACEALGVNRACFYRRRHAQLHPPEQRIRPRPPLALDAERAVLRLDANRFSLSTDFPHRDHQQYRGKLRCQ